MCRKNLTQKLSTYVLKQKKAHNLYTLAPRRDDETTEVTKCASELTTAYISQLSVLNP